MTEDWAVAEVAAWRRSNAARKAHYTRKLLARVAEDHGMTVAEVREAMKRADTCLLCREVGGEHHDAALCLAWFDRAYDIRDA